MTKRRKKPMGRPRSAMTDEVIDAILRTVRLGIWPDRAALIHGVNAATMRSHRKRHPDFATALEKAEADAEGMLHSKMIRHMDKQWTAVAWMLERRFKDRYAKPELQGGAGDGVVDDGELWARMVSGIPGRAMPERQPSDEDA